MPAKSLEAGVRHQPGVSIIDLHGDIDAFGQGTLNEAYAQAESQNPAAILLNFTDVQYINSTGIALVVGLLAKARQARRRMLVSGLSEHYTEIFQITRLADFMSMFSDEASALAELRAPA
jgi:anti-anti-sigma factor